ncbi:MAG: TA system VapC family ribonuclease toxin [Terracidiphilus sp.]
MRKVWLLDVNVLLAWLWPAHEAHNAASGWIHNHRQEPWATCPITEMGFLRIVTNRSFSPHAPAWAEAAGVLRRHTEDGSRHCFWQDSLTLAELDMSFGRRIKRPGQIAGAYLLALAMHHGGRMVTYDYRMEALAPEGSAEREALAILRL